MSATAKRPKRLAALLVCGAASTAAVAGCGGDDFENEPRPPVPVEITGVITKDKVTVSPDKEGGGPIVLTISNQTKDSHTVTLEGVGSQPGTSKANQVAETVGPINPLDTATIQVTLQRGQYEVKAGSKEAVPEEKMIAPAQLEIGPERESGKNQLLLP